MRFRDLLGLRMPLSEGVEPDTCAHRGIKGQRCPDTPTFNATWPTTQYWSANYCDVHIERVRGVPGCRVLPLTGDDQC